MIPFTKTSALVFGATLLTLTAFSPALAAGQEHEHQTSSHEHQTSSQDHEATDGKHKEMMEQMKMDKDMMSKMDMSKVDMSKISSECQTMMGEMKTKMAEDHHDDGMKDHDMSKMEDHEEGSMKNHGSEEMKAKMTKHKQCMAEMKEAMPHSH